jgi:hypothetical protein
MSSREPALFWMILAGVAISAGCAPFEDTPERRCVVSSLRDGGTADSLGIKDATAGRGDEIAQTFIPTFNKTGITELKVGIRRVGTVANLTKLTLEIAEDTVGSPGGAIPNGTSELILTSTGPGQGNVSTTTTMTTFTLAGPVDLVTTKKYWIRIGADYSASAANHIVWAGSDANSISSGSAFFETTTADTFTAVSAIDLALEMGCEES